MNIVTIILFGLVCFYFYVLSGIAFCRLLPEYHQSKLPKLVCFLFWPFILPLSAGYNFEEAKRYKNPSLTNYVLSFAMGVMFGAVLSLAVFYLLPVK